MEGKKVREKRDYIVLQHMGSDDFTVVDALKAGNARQAIDEHVGDDREGTFVAVPVRQFQLRRIWREQTSVKRTETLTPKEAHDAANAEVAQEAIPEPIATG